MAIAGTVLLADDMSYQSRTGVRRYLVQQAYADFLASRLGYSIELLHVEAPSDLPLAKPIFNKIMGGIRTRQMKDIKKHASGFHVPVHCTLAVGNPVEEVLKASRKRSGVDLIVMGTHGRKGLSRLLLGSVAEEVLRHTIVPVMTVGPGAQQDRDSVSLLSSLASRVTLVVATDLGVNSKKAEQFSLRLAKKLGAQVILVHSLAGSLNPVIQAAMVSPGGAPGLEDLIAELRKDALRALKHRKGLFQKAGVKCQAVLSERGANPAQAVLQLLKGATTFAVMGTHSRNSVARAFLGSTAREVILSSPSPVITVASRR